MKESTFNYTFGLILLTLSICLTYMTAYIPITLPRTEHANIIFQTFSGLGVILGLVMVCLGRIENETTYEVTTYEIVTVHQRFKKLV